MKPADYPLQYVDGGLKWVINVVTKLPTSVHGRVGLVGDAVGVPSPSFAKSLSLTSFAGARDGSSSRSRCWAELRSPSFPIKRLVLNQHPTLTFRSQDAFFLARLMSHPDITKEDLPTVLQLYDEIRRPFTQNIVALARRRGQLHHLDSPELAWLTAERSAKGGALSPQKLAEISEMMERCRDWQFGPSVLEESAAAIHKLDEWLLPRGTT